MLMRLSKVRNNEEHKLGYLLICMLNFVNFSYYDKYTDLFKNWYASFGTSVPVIGKISKVEILFVCMDQHRKFGKVIACDTASLQQCL